MIDPRLEVAPASSSTIAAGYGWLAGRAAVILGDRSFLARSVELLVTGRVSIDLLLQLETDIRWACNKAGRPAPSIAEFFEHRGSHDLVG